MPREPRPPSRSGATPSSRATTETASQALERARAHGRRAVAEGLAAVRATLDAAAIGWSGRPSEAHAALRAIAELLDEQSARFAGGEGIPERVHDRCCPSAVTGWTDGRAGFTRRVA